MNAEINIYALAADDPWVAWDLCEEMGWFLDDAIDAWAILMPGHESLSRQVPRWGKLRVLHAMQPWTSFEEGGLSFFTLSGQRWRTRSR